MSENRKSNQVHDLLLPGEQQWEKWSAQGTGQFQLTQTIEHGPGHFTAASNRRTLALPAASAWVLPAWLKGGADTLNDAATMHLERLGARTPGHPESMTVDSLQVEEGAHLCRIVALKDGITPLADFKVLPDDCRLSASCYPLPASSIILWKELGKLVLAITVGPRLVYFAPLSSQQLDANAIGEINHTCLQLTFQRVITEITGIILWMEDGDAALLQRSSGISVTRQDKPEPRLTAGLSKLQPQDIIDARAASKASSNRRLMALSAGFVIAACVALFAVLIGKVKQDRDALLDQVANLSPRASKVEGQKAAWSEAAPAVDPTASPMEALLSMMEPMASGEISLTELEWTPQSIILQGRAPEISPALKYMQEIKDVEGLLAYQWEPGTPEIGENGAAFQLKGTKP